MNSYTDDDGVVTLCSGGSKVEVDMRDEMHIASVVADGVPLLQPAGARLQWSTELFGETTRNWDYGPTGTDKAPGVNCNLIVLARSLANAPVAANVTLAVSIWLKRSAVEVKTTAKVTGDTRVRFTWNACLLVPEERTGEWSITEPAGRTVWPGLSSTDWRERRHGRRTREFPVGIDTRLEGLRNGARFKLTGADHEVTVRLSGFRQAHLATWPPNRSVTVTPSAELRGSRWRPRLRTTWWLDRRRL